MPLSRYSTPLRLPLFFFRGRRGKDGPMYRMTETRPPSRAPWPFSRNGVAYADHADGIVIL